MKIVAGPLGIYSVAWACSQDRKYTRIYRGLILSNQMLCHISYTHSHSWVGARNVKMTKLLHYSFEWFVCCVVSLCALLGTGTTRHDVRSAVDCVLPAVYCSAIAVINTGHPAALRGRRDNPFGTETVVSFEYIMLAGQWDQAVCGGARVNE